MSVKKFDKKYLKDLGLPFECEGGIVHEDNIVDNSRWSIRHVVVFSLPGQPEGDAYRADYSIGATESQDERPWEFEDTVECEFVRRKEVTVVKWVACKET